MSAPTSDDPKERTLGEVLRRSGWDRLIGTWIDADTQGAGLKTTYAWKIEDRVVEVTSESPQRESAALMGFDARSGEIFQTGADSQGTRFTGKWDIQENGDALFALAYSPAQGQDGTLSLRYHRVDDDTLIMTVELPQPIRVKLVRSKPAS